MALLIKHTELCMEKITVLFLVRLPAALTAGSGPGLEPFPGNRPFCWASLAFIPF